MSFIQAENLSFSYDSHKAIDNLNLSIEQGSFVAVTGKSGCGKSTFAKLLDALLTPQKGKLTVNGYDVSDKNNFAAVRKTVGLVFQNPDNQIIGETVEEDVAFGPENLGLESSEIERRIIESLEMLDISDLRFKRTSDLSGGEKQKVAIAGILAIGSECIVLDEALSMLDTESRQNLLELLKSLNEKGKTIILITHDMRDAEYCKTIIDFSEVQHA